MMQRLTRKLVPPMAAVLVAAGCGGPSGTAADQAGAVRYAANGTFTLAVDSDRGVFDPYHSQLILGYYPLAYDSMLNQKPDGTFVSGLAEKWDIGTTEATFTIRKDVTCSDGTPMTATQVASALTYLSNPKNASPLYGLTVPKLPFTATGDDSTRTVKLTMSKPYGLVQQTIGLTPIMCAKGMKDRKLLSAGSDGTGPFVLSKYVPGDSYTFTVRDGYAWGPDGARTSEPGTPKTVVIKIVENETTAANLLLSGGLSFAEVKGDDRQRLTAAGLRKLDKTEAGAWLWFNQLGGRPSADQRVRQALAHGLNLDGLVKVSTGGTGTASTGLVALKPRPCSADTVSGRLPRHDTAEAAKLLDAAGWTRGADGFRSKGGKRLTLSLHYAAFTSPLFKPTAESIAQQWKDLGVEVNLTGDNAAALGKAFFETSDWDVYMQGFGVYLPSQMIPFVSGPKPPAGTNLAGIENAAYDTAASTAGGMLVPDACKYWDEAEQALYRDVDVVPVANVAAPQFLRNAQAEMAGFGVVPTSLRVLD
jgi:peptide/nickel transport system substrate-binding protein